MSRRFGMIKPEVLWTGPLARQFRNHPAEIRELATYLLAGPPSDTWGIWHLELDTIVLQTGRKEANITRAFAVLEELKFAFYDVMSQFVWVPDMPASQFVRWPLSPHDNNVRHAKRWYAALPPNPFLGDWYDHHLSDLHLDAEPEAVERRALEAPPKGPSPSQSKEITSDLLGEKEILPAHTRARGMSASELDKWFESVCAIYPKQAKLSRARTVLAKLKPTPELLATIMEALSWQVKQHDWLKEGGHYAPSLFNYFNDKRWLDRKPATVAHVNKGTHAVVTGMADFISDRDECRTPPRNVRALPQRSGK